MVLTNVSYKYKLHANYR